MQNFFLSILPERVNQVSLRMHSNSAQKKPALQKQHHVTKFKNSVRLLTLKKKNLEAMEKRSSIRKNVTTRKSQNSSRP